MELDPKGASNQVKELIDRQYNGDDLAAATTPNPSTSRDLETPNVTPFQARGPVAGSANSTVAAVDESNISLDTIPSN